jgi:hypothetical protein
VSETEGLFGDGQGLVEAAEHPQQSSLLGEHRGASAIAQLRESRLGRRAVDELSQGFRVESDDHPSEVNSSR